MQCGVNYLVSKTSHQYCKHSGEVCLLDSKWKALVSRKVAVGPLASFNLSTNDFEGGCRLEKEKVLSLVEHKHFGSP